MIRSPEVRKSRSPVITRSRKGDGKSRSPEVQKSSHYNKTGEGEDQKTGRTDGGRRKERAIAKEQLIHSPLGRVGERTPQ